MISDLQLSLLAIGAVVIAGVYAFNRFQERKFKRIAETHFKSGHDDVLLDENSRVSDNSLHIETIVQVDDAWRIEPRFESIDLPAEPLRTPVETVAAATEDAPEVAAEPVFSPVEVEESPHVVPAFREEGKFFRIDDAIACVATLQAGETILTEDLALQLQKFAGIGKPVYWSGLRNQTGVWEEVRPEFPAEYEKIQIGLQLADRNGHITEAQLARFCDIVQSIAGDLQAIMDCPDKQPTLQRAIDLDDFCAEVDVLIGLNVLSQNGEPLAATKIRALAESSGMKLQPDGTFHYVNDDGISLYSLSNHEPAPFAADSIKHMTTHGVTLLFDVPRAPGGIRTFDHLVSLAKQMAHSLNGVLVDDNRNPLNEKSIASIKQQLATLYAKMDSRQISAGSQRALRLFS